MYVVGGGTEGIIILLKKQSYIVIKIKFIVGSENCWKKDLPSLQIQGGGVLPLPLPPWVGSPLVIAMMRQKDKQTTGNVQIKLNFVAFCAEGIRNDVII